MPIVCACEEAGGAAYLEPVIRRLLALGLVQKATILASEGALQHFQNSVDLPTAPIDARNADTLHARLASLMPFDLLLTTCSGSRLESICHAFASEHGIRAFGAIDTLYNVEKKFCGISPHPERALVIDASVEQTLKDCGIASTRIDVVGHPVWEGANPLTIPAQQRAVFIEQPVQKHYGSSLGYTEATAWELAQEACEEVGLALDYAKHPSTVATDLPDGASIISSVKDHLANYSHILGMFSGFMMDSWLAGRRVISLQPGTPASNQCPLSQRGLIPRVGDKASLCAQLEQPWDSDLPDNPFAGSLEKIIAVISQAITK